MRYAADEGKTGYKVVNVETEKLVGKNYNSLLDLVGDCSEGDTIFTEQSRQNFKLEEREKTDSLAKSRGVELRFIPTRAIKIYRFDHKEGKAEGRHADLMDARRLARVVKSGIHTLAADKANPPEYYEFLNSVRDRAKDRTVVLRRTGWEDESLLTLLPDCEHKILSGGQKRKLKFKASRVLPLVIAAQETVRAGRGFKFFEAVIGNFGAGYPNLFRSNLNFHWLRATGTEREERKQFFKELRPALKWIFREVKSKEGLSTDNLTKKGEQILSQS